MALRAVVNENGFERWLDAGDFRLVDVRLTLLLARVFDIEIDEFLAVDNCNTELFGLG